jgi:hypothetical protein
MSLVKAYKVSEICANLSPLSVKREWMDNTQNAHAYHCFPVSLTNQMGWGISFPEDITFIWDGISDANPGHVKVLSGHKYASPGRANATISFNTGIMFRTNEDTTLFQMPVPNYPRDGVSPFSILMTTSFYSKELPVAWQITRPNVEITIKANTPVIAIVPLNLSEINNSEILFDDISNAKMPDADNSDYSAIGAEINNQGKWTDWYRNATNHLGQKLGYHQVKKFDLDVK